MTLSVYGSLHPPCNTRRASKGGAPKRLGLPKMNQLQEFDVDFRQAPVRWLLASAIDDASKMETGEKSAMAAADLSNSNDVLGPGR